jgi:hypothetical protein
LFVSLRYFVPAPIVFLSHLGQAFICDRIILRSIKHRLHHEGGSDAFAPPSFRRSSEHALSFAGVVTVHL